MMRPKSLVNGQNGQTTGRFRLIIIAVILMLSMTGMFFFFKSSAVTSNLSYSLYDYFIDKKSQALSTESDIVMIVIDDKSIRTLEKIWPWPRAYHAGLIRELTKMGAKVIAYDILFTESSSGDALLSKTIEQHGAVVLPKPLFLSSDGVIPFNDVAHFGHVDVNIDGDGIVRSIDPYLDGMRSFSFAILDVLAQKDDRLPTAQHLYRDELEDPIRFVYSLDRNYPIYSFSDVFMGKIAPSEFKDKVVFVGVSASGIGERMRSSSLKNSTFKTGVEIQASIFEALRTHAVTEYAGTAFNTLAMVSSVVGMTIVAIFATPVMTVALLLLYIGFLTAVTFLLFYFYDYWYSPIALSFAMISVIFVYTIVRIHLSLKEANRTLNLNVADRTKKLVISNLRLAQEMNEKEKIWADLRNSEEQLKALLDGLQIGIVSTDQHGELITANVTALDFFDLDSVENAKSLDQYFQFDIAHGGGKISTRELFKTLMDVNDSTQVECVLASSNPRFNGIPTSLLLSRLSASSEREVNFACIIRDISDQKRAEFITQEFVATVSHELRTPITSIKGSLGLMNSGIAGEIPQKAQKLLELATRNSDRLLSLVNDILDIQKIQLGTLDFHLKTIDIVSVVRQSIEVNELYAQNLGVTIVGYLPSYPIYVMGDSDRLAQIMSNLLSNAAKFSKPDSRVDVRVMLDGKRVRVDVEDYGVGIPDSFSDKVFMKFAQADDAKHRSKGTGLGLSISKAFIERMRGTIHYESQENVGTLFYFYLPLASMEEVNNYISDQKAKKDMFL
ncbi:CHASE2 domain-containing protein [Wohlfahrtiimonas chitiniclastica]|uniref:CHASE2 domain-containing protein n=1 Tax=Wohlfahrtiimonas chitiniclastica TaxID=400946 RepID=UPI001FEEE2A6|nr:CHASE2 domain-containing protein [Wohlfahrtiimonas chitiniclastica]